MTPTVTPADPVRVATRVANALETGLPRLLRYGPTEATCLEWAHALLELAEEVRSAGLRSRRASGAGSLRVLLAGLAKELEALARHCTARDLLAASEVDPDSLRGLRGTLADLQAIAAVAHGVALRWREQLAQQQEEAA